MISIKSFLFALTLSVLASQGTFAQGNPAFDWIARTSEAGPNLGLSPGSVLRPHGAGLRQFSVEQDLVRVSDLVEGRWVTRHAMRHQMTNRRYPQITQSHDQQTAYIWNFNERLEVSEFDEQHGMKPLLQVQHPLMNRLMYSQSGGTLEGDAANGFWVTNDYVGSALFVEPGTWAIREVPGLSVQGTEITRAKSAFVSSAVGSGDSLWIIESDTKDVVRRDSLGNELARVRWPFDNNLDQARTRGLASYGSGELQPSRAGVLAISSTRLDLALISETGQVQWKVAVCPAGVTVQCADEAKEQGRLSLITAAMTDEAGNAWIKDRTNAMFFFKGTGDPVRRSGNVAPCIAQVKGNSSTQKPSSVCVGSSDRLVRLDDRRYLIYRRGEHFSARFFMTVEHRQPSRIAFLPLETDMADLPLADREAIFQSMADLRVWGFDEDPSVPASRSQWNPGIPTGHGIATDSRMMRKYLSHPGAIRTPEDGKLSKLFYPPTIFDAGARSMARMGPSAVVIKDRRAPPTQLAQYDMQSQELRQGIEVRGLPAATGCGLSNTSLEYVFNDDTDALYLFREWTGEVFSIDPSFDAKLVAQLPEIQPAYAPGCGASTVVGVRVPLAARTPSGKLVIATHQGVFVRRGAVFVRVEAPDQVVQLVVLNETEALVIAKGGLARLKLPT